MNIRDRLVALALEHENSGPGMGEVARKRYVELLQSPDPADRTPQAVAYFADPRTSSCALTVRGLWRRAGLVHALLGAYYLPERIGHAVLDLLTIAREAGAYMDGHALARLPGTTGAYVPQVGDMGYVAAPEHVFTVIAVEPSASGYQLTTIDGGQLVAGQQAITRRFRVWRRGGALLTDVPRYGGAVKQVMGMVDVSRLPFPAPSPCSAAAA